MTCPSRAACVWTAAAGGVCVCEAGFEWRAAGNSDGDGGGAYGGECVGVCGDGAVVAGEACDDGNGDDDDGCSRACQIETGWICSARAGPVGAVGPGPSRCR